MFRLVAGDHSGGRVEGRRVPSGEQIGGWEDMVGMITRVANNDNIGDFSWLCFDKQCSLLGY